MSKRTRLSVSVLGTALTVMGCAATNDYDLFEERAQAFDWPERSNASADAEPAKHAEPELGAADLEAYVRFGLANNAGLRAAFEDWRAGTERIEQTGTLPDPRLTFVESIEAVQTRTGPQERRFGISQAFPWPGALDARGEVAAHQAEALWHAVQSERLRVQAEIEVAYFEYAFLAREQQISRELLELLRGLEPVVQSRVRSGAGQADLLRLQVEVGRLEDNLASIERRRPVLSARLAQAMTLPPDDRELLPLPELREPTVGAVDVAQSYTQALDHNPELHALAEQLRASQAAEGAAGYRSKPEFAVMLDYIQTGAALNPATPGSGDDPFMIGVSMTLPIWGKSYSAGEREARHRWQATRERIVAAESRIQAELEEHAFRSDDAARRINLYRDSLIPRAKEALELTLAAYRTGAASILDLIDSERALLEFELSFWRACLEHWQSTARLQALLGGADQ